MTKYFNTNDEEIQESDCDLENGFLVPFLIEGEWVEGTPAVEQQGHVEYTAFYFTDGTSYKVTGKDDPHVKDGEYIPDEGEEPREVFGKDTKYVVDVKYKPAVEGYHKTETAYVYVPYSTEDPRYTDLVKQQIARKNQENLIASLQNLALPFD